MLAGLSSQDGPGLGGREVEYNCFDSKVAILVSEHLERKTDLEGWSSFTQMTSLQLGL